MTPASVFPPVCQCEHADHFDVYAPVHRYQGVFAGERRTIAGPICDDCATGHLRYYLLDEDEQP